MVGVVVVVMVVVVLVLSRHECKVAYSHLLIDIHSVSIDAYLHTHAKKNNNRTSHSWFTSNTHNIT